MARDQQGLALAGAPESASAFDRAMADYYGLTGDPVGVLKSALARDPGFALGGVAIAALTMIGGFRGDHPEVTSALRAAEAAIGRASQREQNHLAAAKAWARGAFSQAIMGWETILADYPTDALALRLVQDAYFFLGRSAAIRDCAERVLPAWGRDNPLAGFVLGLYAFGLEETGDLKRAEDFGREALARNRRDAWATHALAHVMETANRHEEGVAFLKSTRADWAHAHFMAHHNGWHLALFLIEQGRFDEVLADYDRFTAPKLADDATLDRIDASSLLWRLELAGVDVGDRWAPVAEHMDGACRRPSARLQRSALRLRRRALARARSRRTPAPVARRVRARGVWREPASRRPKLAGASSMACSLSRPTTISAPSKPFWPSAMTRPGSAAAMRSAKSSI